MVSVVRESLDDDSSIEGVRSVSASVPIGWTSKWRWTFEKKQGATDRSGRVGVRQQHYSVMNIQGVLPVSWIWQNSPGFLFCGKFMTVHPRFLSFSWSSKKMWTTIFFFSLSRRFLSCYGHRSTVGACVLCVVSNWCILVSSFSFIFIHRDIISNPSNFYATRSIWCIVLYCIVLYHIISHHPHPRTHSSSINQYNHWGRESSTNKSRRELRSRSTTSTAY